MNRNLTLKALVGGFAALAVSAAGAQAPALPRIAGTGPFLLLQPDGTVALLGEFEHLPPGDGSGPRRGNRALPQTLPDVDGVMDAAGSGDHAVLLRTDGQVLGWGDSCAATGQQQGNGPDQLLQPTPVPALAGQGGAQLAAGGHFTALRTADGRVIVWGQRPVDDDGLIPSRPWGCAAPLRLPLARIVQISAGTAFLLALRDDGRVFSAGRMAFESPPVPRPQAVAGLPEVAQVAALGTRALALGRDGSVWQWGEGREAQPRQVPLPGRAVAVQGHGGYAMAQTADGALWVWGEGYGGVFGDGSFDHTSERPLKVALRFRPVAWQAMNHAVFAWQADGTLVGWGSHGFTPPGSPRRGHSTVPEPLLRWTAPAQWASALRPWPGALQGVAR